MSLIIYKKKRTDPKRFNNHVQRSPSVVPCLNNQVLDEPGYLQKEANGSETLQQPRTKVTFGRSLLIQYYEI